MHRLLGYLFCSDTISLPINKLAYNKFFNIQWTCLLHFSLLKQLYGSVFIVHPLYLQTTCVLFLYLQISICIYTDIFTCIISIYPFIYPSVSLYIHPSIHVSYSNSWHMVSTMYILDVSSSSVAATAAAYLSFPASVTYTNESSCVLQLNII